MTLTEFTDHCVALDENYRMFSREEFDTITMVYLYYPKIGDKKDIATLYVKYGMLLMNDMLPRALEVKELEEEISSHKAELEKKQEKLRELTETRR